MTRYELLLSAYAAYDLIYTGLILLAAWVAGTGHLLDVVTARRGRIILSVYWELILALFVAGLLFVGLVLT